MPYTSKGSAGMFRYSEECLRRTNQEKMDWSLELSNIRNISKSIGKITILLGQLHMLKEHCSEMIINKTTEEEMRGFLIKQTVGFNHCPHLGLCCFHTLYLSVYTKLREIWSETRRVQVT
jgi:hypothetical protein